MDYSYLLLLLIPASALVIYLKVKPKPVSELMTEIASMPIFKILTTTKDDVTFALRGDSLTPYHVEQSTGAYTYKNNASATEPSSVADAGTGVIGGNVIDIDGTTYQRGVYYLGGANFSQNAGFSILVRAVMRYTGTPSQNQGLFNATKALSTGALSFAHLTTDKLFFQYSNRYNTSIINMATTSSWSPVANTVYDLVLTWDGTTTANAVKFYVDGSIFHQGTASGTQDHTTHPLTVIESGAWITNGSYGNFDLNELVLFNTVIDPTDVLLESGAGSLNGASRTSLVAADQADGLGSGGGVILKVI